MGKEVQEGNDRLAQVPVVGNLLLQIIQAGAGIVLLGGLVNGKEDLAQERFRRISIARKDVQAPNVSSFLTSVNCPWHLSFLSIVCK